MDIRVCYLQTPNLLNKGINQCRGVSILTGLNDLTS